MKIKHTFTAPILLLIVLILKISIGHIDFVSIGLTGNPYLTYGLVQVTVFAIPCVIYCLIHEKEYIRCLRLRPFRLEWIVLLLTAVLTMEVGSLAMNLLVTKLTGNPNDAVENIILFSAGDIPEIFAVIAFCILPAILEEFLFRGILIADYEGVNTLWAVLIGAVFYASFSLSSTHFLSTLYCGVIYAVTLYATRSLLAPMILHTVHNFVLYLGQDYILRAADITGGRGIMLLTAVLAIMFALLFLFVSEWKNAYLTYAQEKIPAEYARHGITANISALGQALLAPPFILYWILFILYAVLQNVL